jgi:diguanylate cyclase (GGDEF)-like protein
LLNAPHRETLTARSGGNFSLLPAPSAAASAATDGEVVIEHEYFRARKTIFEGATAVLAIESQGVRPLAQQQTRATQLLLWSMALTIITGLLLTYILLHRLVIHRLRGLGAWAQARREQPKLARYEQTSNDEIDVLRTDFEALTQDLEQLTDRWRTQARQDWLTGIGNRAQLFADLDAAQGDESKPIALLLIDLDHFKAVNDLMGHQSGDELLREVAQQFSKLMPPDANVYRIGGDEFAVLWLNFSSSKAMDDLAAALLNAVRSQRCAVGVSASIGIVENMRGAEVPQDFLMHADVALYAAKQAGRGIAHRFTTNDLAQFREHFELARQLREALDGGRIEVHFQPIVCARTRRVIAAEALARWTHDGVVVSPSRFVAVAERSRLINALDAYVLQRSCEALTRLQASTPELCLNVNVSPFSLQDDTFLAALQSTLASTSVKTEFLRIELTEGGAGLHSDVLEEAATALRKTNVALVIDDFGAGASSLSRLNRLHPQGLKLDGSFVLDHQGDGGRICRAVVELARELELDLTAECVESAEQAAFLSGIGRPMQQGFFYSPALSEAALVEWINEFHRASPSHL